MAEPGGTRAAGEEEPARQPDRDRLDHGGASAPPEDGRDVPASEAVGAEPEGAASAPRGAEEVASARPGLETGDVAGRRPRKRDDAVARVRLPASAVPEPIELDRLRRDEPHWLNLPNAITFLRALLVPVILWLLATEGDTDVRRWWAFGIFLFAAATDSIDGWVARRWHGVTRWGQLADPIADKLLIVGSLASLALVGDLPWWAVNVIVVREIAVTLLRVQLVQRIGLVMPASNWGKAKTVSQVVAVAAYLLPAGGETIPWLLLHLAVALTVWSGIEYAFRAGRLARDAVRNREDVS